MKILITTGIYPPKIGGPAQYSKNLETQFRALGHVVKVATFSIEDRLPTGIRHLFFLFKIVPRVLTSDFIISLDTFSVGLPTVFACRVFGKKNIIRTGGDFLWEQYVQRTGKKILLRNFYNTEIGNFNLKEKITFKLTRWALKNTSKAIFSTAWQRDIFIKAYSLDINRTGLIENFYGKKEGDVEVINPVFVTSTRDLVLKNLDVLKRVFDKIGIINPAVRLYTDNILFEDFMKQMANSYAVVLLSISEISPNMVLDAIRYNRPFICTREIGIYDRIKDLGIFVDPLNENEIELAILKILNKDEYKKIKEKLKQFTFTHTWQQIGEEFLQVYNSLK